MHEAEADLFVILSKSGTMPSGDKLVNLKRGALVANWASCSYWLTLIDGRHAHTASLNESPRRTIIGFSEGLTSLRSISLQSHPSG